MSNTHTHGDGHVHGANHTHADEHVHRAEHTPTDENSHNGESPQLVAHTHGYTHSHTTGGTPKKHNHSHTHKHTKSVLNRLSRAIGHLTAVRSMVEDERDCAEVLIQLSAVRAAINGVCEIILKDHIDHCIVDAINTGDTEAIEELNRAIALLMK